MGTHSWDTGYEFVCVVMSQGLHADCLPVSHKISTVLNFKTVGTTDRVLKKITNNAEIFRNIMQ